MIYCIKRFGYNNGEIYDIIFMDHTMPEIDGIETVKPTGNYITDTLGVCNDRFDTVKSKLLEYNIEGLDIAKGLEKFKDDVEIYLKLLHVYSSGIRSKIDMIKDSSEENLENYRINVHGIKGTSLEILAEKISEDASLLEKAAVSGDITFINEHNPQFLEAITALLSKIDEMLAFLKNLPFFGGKIEKPKKVKPDETLLLKLLEECNRHYMDGAEMVMLQIEEYQYEKDEELVVWLRENIDMIKFEQAAQRINSYIKGN